MITIVDSGSSVSASNLVQLAEGLRNPTGMDFHPITGDLYLQDNGIDGPTSIEPLSADEINIIPADSLGVVPDGLRFRRQLHRVSRGHSGGWDG
ncbi:MAG: hypothetical protein QF689_14300, partial [Candidatus Latescibacteria bacterium]|nr:hypothetical protein [Candidatus Latescibacterota bacterium]